MSLQEHPICFMAAGCITDEEIGGFTAVSVITCDVPSILPVI